MPNLYDNLIRLGLKPNKEIEFLQKTDSLMKVTGTGVRKLVERRASVYQMKLHVSMIPNDDGVVNAALVTAAAGVKRPGFWNVILDRSGRPVAEHPLTYSSRNVQPSEPDHPPRTQAEEGLPMIETTGEFARLVLSWFTAYDRINDDECTKLLRVLGAHLESPREVVLDIKTRRLAQRLADELLCFIDDAAGIPGADVQASELREKIISLLHEFPV